MPSKSQIAFALQTPVSTSANRASDGHSRFRIDLIEEATAVVRVEDPSETPRLFLHWLDILYLDKQYISRFRGLNLERPRKVVHLGQINIFNIIGTIAVLDLPT